jgi:hypothetical protein
MSAWVSPYRVAGRCDRPVVSENQFLGVARVIDPGKRRSLVAHSERHSPW